MFISLQNILNQAVRRHHIEGKINTINARDISEKVIRDATKTNIKVLWCKNEVIMLKSGSGAAANEIKLKEQAIKKELQKNNLKISSIKCVI